MNHLTVTSDHIDLLLQTKHPVRHKDNNLSEDVKERKSSLLDAQSASAGSTKVPDYPGHPPDSLAESYLGLSVGVLVTVIIVLIVAIVFILYKNYQHEKKNCLKTVDSYEQTEEDWTNSAGQPQTRLYQTGLSDQLYPLYPTYHKSTTSTMHAPYTYCTQSNHYATTDLIYSRHEFGV